MRNYDYVVGPVFITSEYMPINGLLKWMKMLEKVRGGELLGRHDSVLDVISLQLNKPITILMIDICTRGNLICIMPMLSSEEDDMWEHIYHNAWDFSPPIAVRYNILYSVLQ